MALRGFFPWRQAIVLGGAIFLLSWLYTKSTAVEPEKHLHFISTIRTIKQLDANLNQDLLRARYNLLLHYDPFVSTLDQLRALTQPLTGKRSTDYLDELDPALKEIALTLNRTVDEKTAQIEQFKSHNAVFKNSLRYFPILTSQLIKHSDTAKLSVLGDEIENLQREVLVFNLAEGPEQEAEIRQYLERIRTIQPSLSGPLAEEALAVINHTEAILRSKHIVDELTNLIQASSLPAAADSLSERYDSAHGQAMRQSGTYRTLLYIFSILLLGYVFYSVARIKLGALALEKANRQLRDQIVERQHAQDQLTIYKEMINGSNDAIALLDSQLKFQELNAAHCRLIERNEKSSLLGEPLHNLLDANEVSLIQQGLKEHDGFRGEVTYHLGNGKIVDVEMSLFALRNANTIEHYVTILRDISERKAHLVELEFQATHDALTGLANRVQLYSRIEDVVLTRTAGKACLMLLDLDHFKEINDTLGHHAGDMVLCEVGKRIVGAVRNNGLTARLGGDEFAILIPQLDHGGQALQIASRILAALRTPIELTGLAVEISGSIGIALSPEHGDTPSQLMRCADVAMYLAKNNSMGCSIYDPEQDQHSPRRLAIMTGLGQAIEQNQLLLHFQPKLSLATGKVSGFEALVRWRHPEHGMIPPGQFIPLAEMSDLIGPLTHWVVNRALRQAKEWQEAGLDASMAVNFSARNFLDDRLPNKLIELLSQHDLPHDRLEVEITESAIMADTSRSLVIMQKIHEMGLRLAIDDYGTGHSSLAYLQRMPIHSLKIDLSFVRNMLVSKENEVIVHSTIQLAHNLGLSVTAEGVEDEATLEKLRSLGCDEAQGYFIGRPMDAEQATTWLLKQKKTI